ncbi:MAG: STAS/SEC14 domain-containing protein [Candidatus Thiodiazotropha sp.]|jgi:hypothetical protein
MFIVSKTGENHLEITLSGKLDSDDMKHALDELEEKSKDIVNGTLLYDVVDFHLPALGAIAVEFSRLPSMFGWIRKFKRAAVLTDKEWIKKVSELEGAFTPGLEIKGFARAERDKAITWLSS